MRGPWGSRGVVRKCLEKRHVSIDARKPWPAPRRNGFAQGDAYAKPIPPVRTIAGIHAERLQGVRTGITRAPQGGSPPSGSWWLEQCGPRLEPVCCLLARTRFLGPRLMWRLTGPCTSPPSRRTLQTTAAQRRPDGTQGSSPPRLSATGRSCFWWRWRGFVALAGSQPHLLHWWRARPPADLRGAA